ncbi:MAG TPA: vitamin K epoxide reductase family protein [Anaerohalosphaeraceae bacterium]|nr:vitamin K epoxide reductase family protein [Phycisphaerae bacterium]HOK96566.1 vitamin K epoxide reductase family protein [Anaerohalosphaeraceae bacterium]HOL31191.1 vitamin K epoxide reductase family protein [Anaerohalosphaeraceae bacterium]HOM76862.1 vitamin K epoxide reductase family protein [Anaerohalosphaeraceae bacterium]HPC65199.1 vitamin K epoxide reductase family protein [Anaerohalosphaeraceae bacterium]
MVSNEQTDHCCRYWPWWRWILTGMSALGLALSLYLSWHDIADAPMIGCSGGSSCDRVLSSRWSSIAGLVPVSGLAAGAYGALLTAVFFIGTAAEKPIRHLAWAVLLVIAGAAAGCAVWFTILQKWVIGAFCPYCMTIHLLGLLLAVLVVWRAGKECSGALTDPETMPPASPAGRDGADSVPSQKGSSAPSGQNRLHPFGLFLTGLLTAGILAVCQTVFAPPAEWLDGQSEQYQPAVDPHAVPLIGSPEAPYVVVLLFDYACSHCQQMHFMLEQAVSRCGGRLAFALCPTPLNSRCNPYIAQDADEFRDSCQLAKTALAVWLADRRKFAEFENWMFSFESGDRWKPRRIEAAEAKAAELVGQAAFDAARADSRIEEYLQTFLDMYGRTSQNASGAVPKLIFGSRWVIPQPHNADELVAILQNSLAIAGLDS